MGNYKQILYVALILFSSGLYAHDTNCNIIYELDSAIMDSLKNEIDYEIRILNDSLKYSDFYIEMYSQDTLLYFGVNFNNSGIVGELCKYTNRCINIQEYIVPIYFDYDIYYAELFKVPSDYGGFGRIYPRGHLFLLEYNYSNKKINIYR